MFDDDTLDEAELNELIGMDELVEDQKDDVDLVLAQESDIIPFEYNEDD